ncbi:MAG: 30S ribosomal protein S1 [Clostridia bacterium]|jgi:4-hydroxy-3-methylbut-2-enyl diphosphate reductase|nr:30S ribosomal protein S1 [Clostridia bacterium]
MLKMIDENKNAFNEQLAYMDQHDKQIFVGQIVEGEIISLKEKEAFLNIGYKADALLPLKEATFDENANLNDVFSIGDTIEAKVISRKNEDGYVVLSKIELEKENTYNYIKETHNNGNVISITVKEAVKGGLIAMYKGVRIFIPASHIELHHVNDLSTYIGKTIEVQIIEYDDSKRNIRIIASRRELLKAERNRIEEEAWASLEKDMVVEGEVKRLTSFGAFVEVKGVDGLLHVSEMSWARVTKPSSIVKIGDKITVKIIELDKENKRISLSIKALQEDPWNNVELKYPLDSVVLGKVVRFASFGAFVELEPGIDALVHISEISHKRINTPADALTIGQEVKAKIIDIDIENRKIGLSIKAVD